MPNHLRAFLFDPSLSTGTELVRNIFSTWESHNSVAIIPAHFPQVRIDDLIIRIDPTDVTYLDGYSHLRTLAVVENPDLAAVVTTSGTTGNPTPVELDFASMQSSTRSLYRACNIDNSTNWLCCLPPYYIAGLSIFARSFVSGSQMIFHEQFDIKRIERELHTSHIKAISLVPRQLTQLLHAKIDLSSLECILVGGISMDHQLIERCKQLLLPIYRTYGMTETWGGICHDGVLFDNTQARIQNGCIELRSESLMSGYRHNYPKTMSRITSDGWFKTQDRGDIVDEKLIVYGRNDDVINSGGVKVDPISVEQALQQIYPELNCVIIGTSHPSLGECVTLCVAHSENSILPLTQIRNLLRDLLPNTHLPVRIGIVNHFPITDSGKILRHQLAQLVSITDEHNI